jgi:microcystin-dependent protein
VVNYIGGSNPGWVLSNTTGISVTIGNAGGGASHNNMQPSAFWSIMIKL